MGAANPFGAYLRAVRKALEHGGATEHTHRPALNVLLEDLGQDIVATNEPKRTEVGAPDFIVTRGGVPVGYVEAKDVGASLDDALKTEQLERYLEGLPNLVLTNYLEFRWFVSGEHRQTALLGRLGRGGKVVHERGGEDAVSALLNAFFAEKTPIVGTAKELAERMAGITKHIRQLIAATFESEHPSPDLEDLRRAFHDVLLPDLDAEQFADMYAQTIAYGLFAARYHASSSGKFTREHAAYDLPKTNPFLRKVFARIAGPDLDDRVAWAVDQLADLLRVADMQAISQDFGRHIGREDPVVHFYETFLRAYDPKERKIRGVYYTPAPVVSYIVRSVDYLLKTRFNRPKGLADETVLVLDPACGTGTFLYAVIDEIHRHVVKEQGPGMWSSYVREKLLNRIFGFEIMMAPYAIAHMKLGIQLRETGYDFSGDERLGIYLTNTLEEAAKKSELLIAQWISDEANAAAEIKRDKPIMVVLGNPPYSVSSANRGEHIEKLMNTYKQAVRSERNIQPLSDDYIKFIRFAHWRIQRTGHGIVGMITNHAWLSGLIHRGMRKELMKTFPEIYVLDLHGNARIGETTPDGGKDENVFDIQQGVAISLMVRPEGRLSRCRARHSDVWGERQTKYHALAQADVEQIAWKTIEPAEPHYFFVPKELTLIQEHAGLWDITEAFPTHGSGIKTRRDHLMVAFDRGTLVSRFSEIASDASDEELRDRYDIRDTAYWKLSDARKHIKAEDLTTLVCPLAYRPFDLRFVYYNPQIIERGDARWPIMRHMLHDNVALIATRQWAAHRHFVLLSTRWVTEISSQPYAPYNLFPLYLYPEEGTTEERRRANLNPKFVKEFSGKLSLDFIPDGMGDLQQTFGPEDIFNYAYAVFHSPTYRERYAEFLKIDFPRLPLTSDRKLFAALAEKGAELVSLHLMESPKLDELITRYPVSGSDVVEKVRYSEPKGDTPGRVYINKKQYFEGIAPELWEFHVGGYQVMQKWLKDRKGRRLTHDDLQHYQKIAVALTETMRLMREIDEVIPRWPLS